MKNLAVPTLLAAVVAAAVAMFMPRSDSGGTAPTAPGLTAADVTRLLAGYKKNPPSTTLTLYKDTSTTCKAEVDSDPVGNLPEKKVFWYVINEDCPLKEAHPKVKLVFIPVKDQYPFTKKEVESKRQN